MSVVPVAGSVAGWVYPVTDQAESPSEPCTPLSPGRAGMPPAAGVPKSVKAEKIWLS